MKRTIITAVAAVIFAAGCTAGSGGGNIGQDAPPAGDPSGVWIAGDSIAEGTGYRLAASGDFSIAQGSTGYLVRGVKASNVPERIALMRADHGDPSTLLILAGGNDLHAGYPRGQVFTIAVALHDELEAQGIDVRFVTTPIPDHDNIGTWTNGELTALNQMFLDSFGDTIDCGPAGHPTETWGNFPVHPTPAGYDNLAACIYNHL